jgi:hypothetical protein
MEFVMGFSTKRGRPATVKSTKDFGTKELILKKQLALTKPPIDILLSKSIITNDQHNAALKFKWLYNLRFGNLKLKAYDGFNLRGSIEIFDQEYLAKKSKIYLKIANYLHQKRILNIVSNIVIFDLFPIILLAKTRNVAPNYSNKILLENDELNGLKDGLNYMLAIFSHRYVA